MEVPDVSTNFAYHIGLNGIQRKTKRCRKLLRTETRDNLSLAKQRANLFLNYVKLVYLRDCSNILRGIRNSRVKRMKV